MTILEKTTCITELVLTCINFVVYNSAIGYILVKNYKTLAPSNIVLLLLPPFAFSILIGFQSYQNSNGKACVSSAQQDTALLTRIALTLMVNTMMLKTISVH
jgi:hypothetical protein